MRLGLAQYDEDGFCLYRGIKKKEMRDTASNCIL